MAASVRFDQRLTVPEHVAAREVDGDLVLLNFDTESYFGLDDVGSRIFAVLRSSSTIEAAVPVLLAEFAVEETRLRTDIVSLVSALVDGGLVALAPA